MKTASENYCKNLNTIQRSDQKFKPFWVVNLVLRDQTSASPSCDSIPTPRQTPPETPVKIKEW
jgi:hypothetical protein